MSYFTSLLMWLFD